MKRRLDQILVVRGLVSTRSQAENYIKLGDVKVNDAVVTKPGYLVSDEHKIELTTKEQYVSRAALKLASVAEVLHLDFQGRTMLDIGSSTGGFTEYALRHGAKKVIAIEVGTNQLHRSLRTDPRIELHEKTDIRDFGTNELIDLAVADVSFVSLREILPSVIRLITADAVIVAMVKPQFEAAASNVKHKGVVKNDRLRRDILKDFEAWAKDRFVIIDKADSLVAGAKGNQERFYLLRKLPVRNS
jgi:23S rRNA (cytidine1920-2'-O)/16S rRNA (cytidine1409-2'-O)-methyltransferase